PVFVKLTVSVALEPGEIVAVFCSTPLPSISSAWSVWPAFVALNVTVPVLGIVTVDGVSLYSVSLILIVLPEPAGAAAWVVVPLLLLLPPQPANATTRRATGARRLMPATTGRPPRPDCAGRACRRPRSRSPRCGRGCGADRSTTAGRARR